MLSINVDVTAAAPGDFQVAHGLGGTPEGAVIQMTTPGGLWFQSPTKYDDTYLYLSASDTAVAATIFVFGNVSVFSGPTLTLTDSIQWVQTFIGIRPLIGVGNSLYEPAMTNANWVRTIIMSPPFKWRWNRNTASFAITVAGGQDYLQGISDFGFIEKAIITDVDGNTKELEVLQSLGNEGTENEPTFISVLIDDGGGNITFRITPPPDKDYTLDLVYQRAVPLITTGSASWGPIPDNLSYIYNQGFLAKCYEQVDDPRYVQATQAFLQFLLAASAGLSETEKNLFLDQFLNSQRQAGTVTFEAQRGNARGRL